MSDEFIREVDEDLRREELNEFFRRYRWWLVGLLVLVLAVVGGREAWKSQREASLRAASESFATLSEAASLETDAQARADLLGTGSAELEGGFAVLALFEQASALMEGKAFAEAADVYLAAGAAIARRDAGLADYAQTLAAVALLQAGGQADRVRDILEPLSAPGGAFRSSALELLTVLDLEDEQYERARERLGELTADGAVPPTITGRARVLLGAIPSGDGETTGSPAQ